MSIEAMKQALESFKKIHEGCGFVKKDNLSKESNELATLVRKDCNFAMEDLRQAIAEAEKQEPFAWIHYALGYKMQVTQHSPEPPHKLLPEYFKTIPVYTAPPKREWVGLTDEEIKEIIGPWGETPIKGYTRKLFDQIEAKLKDKNT
jgi:hypothetical protein